MKKYLSRPVAILLAAAVSIPSPMWANPGTQAFPQIISSLRLDQEALASLAVWPRFRGAINVRHSLSLLPLFPRIVGGADTRPWNAPYKEGTVRLKDGRLLGYAEYGDPKGIPLLYMAGSQGSRYEVEAYAIGNLERQGVRVIVLERPGIGNSTPKPDHKVEDWPKDILQFVNQHLGPNEKFGVFGYSAGGPWTLACMADEALKSRIVWGGLYATLGRIDSVEKLERYNGAMKNRYKMGLEWRLGASRQSERNLKTFVESWRTKILSEEGWEENYKLFIGAQSPVDREILSRPSVAEAMKRSWQATFEHGPEGWIDDHAALTAPRTFEWDDITGPVHIWHGTADYQVPFAVAEELARNLPNAVLHPLKGQAHRAIVDEFPKIVEEFRRSVQIEARDNSRPGEFPYTGGIHQEMYSRNRFWTMRQYAGFSTAQESNKRYRMLLEKGVSGLSVAFDLYTQMGYDAGNLSFPGEEGRVGVSISSLHDMEILFEGIDLGAVSTSMTINATAAILLAMYIAVGKKQGVPIHQLQGTLQNDILKEFISRNTYIYPVGPSMRLTTDIFAYTTKHLPKFNPISISGYHMGEKGATAVQEVGFTLANGIAYVKAAIKAGLNVDELGPRLSFFFVVNSNLLVETAKFRAARRLWAYIMRDRFQAQDERSLKMRFHAQTAGSSLTAQQPNNNIVRVALQAAAAILGGTQSLHTNSRDEARGLPTEESVEIALRTQQIIAYESGLAQYPDALAGSYVVERLTDEIAQGATELIAQVDGMGGMIPAIESGFPSASIEGSAYEDQRNVESGKRVVVGVNRFQSEERSPLPTSRIDESTRIERVREFMEWKKMRDFAPIQAALAALQAAARGTDNLIPFIIAAVEAYATVEEISETLVTVFGRYVPNQTGGYIRENYSA